MNSWKSKENKIRWNFLIGHKASKLHRKNVDHGDKAVAAELMTFFAIDEMMDKNSRLWLLWRGVACNTR
jgi:hypothetical protein